MLSTEHGWWPYEGGFPADMEYFRHSRIHLVEEWAGEFDRHIVSVAVVTMKRFGLPRTEDIRIVAEGLQNWQDGQRLNLTEDARYEISLSDIVGEESLAPALKSIWRSEQLEDFDGRHGLICHFVKDAVKTGDVRAKPEAPTEEQVAYAW